MAVLAHRDLDYWVVRLHGRHSRLAEGARLNELCRLRTVAELARSLGAVPEIRRARDLQRWLIGGWSGELNELARCMPESIARLLVWQSARMQLENIKLLARGFVAKLPFERLQPLLIEVPNSLLACDMTKLGSANSLEQFINSLPDGVLKTSVREYETLIQLPHGGFIIESALDKGYLTELTHRARELDAETRAETQPLLAQEVDIWHAMVAARGVLYHGVKPEVAMGLHVAGSAIPEKLFMAMLRAPDIKALTVMLQRRVVRGTPATPEAAALEALAWSRYWHLANTTFRRSHIGGGAVIGYVALRRIELANLITLSEG